MHNKNIKMFDDIPCNLKLEAERRGTSRNAALVAIQDNESLQDENMEDMEV